MKVNKLNRKKTIGGIIIGLICFGLFLYHYTYQNEIKDYGKVAIGNVYKTSVGYKGGIGLECSYIVNGVKYFKGSKILLNNTFRNKFKNKNFPVMYSSKDHSKALILILPSDFKNFDLDYPDSLKWVKELERISNDPIDIRELINN